MSEMVFDLQPPFHPVSEPSQSETLITGHRSMMEQKTPTSLPPPRFAPVLPSHIPLTYTHICTSNELLSEWKSRIYRSVWKSVSAGATERHILLRHAAPCSSPSVFTGRALQWKVSGVLGSTQGVFPTAVLWSELPLAQRTGGTAAEYLLLPREHGNRREQLLTGANNTSLPPFKFLREEKGEFLQPVLSSEEGSKPNNPPTSSCTLRWMCQSSVNHRIYL